MIMVKRKYHVNEQLVIQETKTQNLIINIEDSNGFELHEIIGLINKCGSLALIITELKRRQIIHEIEFGHYKIEYQALSKKTH